MDRDVLPHTDVDTNRMASKQQGVQRRCNLMPDMVASAPVYYISSEESCLFAKNVCSLSLCAAVHSRHLQRDCFNSGSELHSPTGSYIK